MFNMPSKPRDNVEHELCDKSQREHRRSYARRPKQIGNLVAQLITTRGYGRIESDEQLQAAWKSAAGEQLAAISRACRVHRGKLEVLVGNSTARQELEFRRAAIVAAFSQQHPELRVREVRFRVGRL